MPTTVTVDIRDFVNGVTGRQTYTLLDIPAGAAGAQRRSTTSRTASYKYDTLQFAFNKRFGSGLFIQSSFDYQWRDELRGGAASTTGSTATLIAPSGSPLNSDPLTIGYFQNVFPQVSNRQESTNWQGRAIARYVFKYDIGVATNLRVQSGYAYSRIIAATLPNAGAARFYSEDINNNRSDTVPILDLRIDKAFRVGRYRVHRDVRRVQPDELERGDQLQPDQRRHRTTRSSRRWIRGRCSSACGSTSRTKRSSIRQAPGGICRPAFFCLSRS